MADPIAVQQVIHRYWNALDRRDYSALLDLLTEDVDWRVSAVCNGREAVAAVLNARPANLVVRHLVSNMVVEAADDGNEAFFLLTAFGRMTAEGEQAPYPTEVPQVLGDMRATIVNTDGTLRIRRLAAAPVFRAAH